MNVIEYITNDGHCYIGCFLKKIAISDEWVHPKYGEIIVNEKKGNDIIIVMDGQDMIVRIDQFDDKRKYSYIHWSLISPKPYKIVSSGVTKWDIDCAKAIQNL